MKMVSKNGSREAAGHNCIDVAKFQDAEPIDAEHARETREWAVHKRMGGVEMMDGLRDAGIPGQRLSEPSTTLRGRYKPPNRNKCSEITEITGKLWK
jgi:hypothetical protein